MDEVHFVGGVWMGDSLAEGEAVGMCQVGCAPPRRMLMLFIGTLSAHPGKLEVRNLRTCPEASI